MSYTPDAMISVLQKAEAAAREKTRDNPHVTLHLENQDEYDCYNIAAAKGWVADSYGKMYAFTYAGLLELHRLLESKKDENSKKLAVRLDILAICFSACSITLSGLTLWIIAINHYFPAPVREVPVRVVNVIETLPNQSLLTQDSDPETEACEPNAETSEPSADIHKN